MATTELIDLAVEVSQQAYVPYSHFPIGAVLLTKDGEIYTGVKPDLPVTLVSKDKSTVVMTVKELLPYSFTDLT